MSDQYFIQLNRSIMELYDRGHLMTAGEVAIRLNSIATNAHRMVDRRRQAFNMPPPEPPAAQPNIGRPVAQLRPAAPRPHRQVLSIKRKVLARAAFAANCGENCAICMDTHQKGESLTTSCGHDFGKECYQNWFNSANSSQSCPTCRAVNPQVTIYSKRVYRAPQPQNNLVNVVENNVV